MKTPILPKRAPWTEEDEAHLQKTLATFPVWNSHEIEVARRAFQSAVDRRAELDRQGKPNDESGVEEVTKDAW
ncbi:hypothetical protein [Rhodococcus globerulus]|uniref:Uncharacterized protein n=1 Tax=Rhodococcus globerulus TaxID=33008 RepID=A0ABU4C5F0_RHOGO|nr:hypothetical protein [Rhodococcus globerulus]MDV6271738.1 hypothetical protein [Rhodococcus globerulus]